MIQLATDPTASRMSYRPPQAQEQPKDSTFEKRARPGHAWPFLSRYAGRPADQNSRKSTASDSGS